MYINRHVEKEIIPLLKRKEIIAVVGARQVGKTTTLNKILDNIKNKKINRISFDNITDKTIFEKDTDSFIDIHIKGYDILFIDEIQYVKESGKILKYIYDKENIKIIITGSSATELSIQSSKFLVGRVFVLTLFPFNFEEFLEANNKKIINTYKKGIFKETITQELNKEKEKFLMYGGYPAVVTEKDKKIKERILQNIYNTYLLKEIKELLHLAENDKLIKLLNILAIQTGNIINYTDLAQETSFSIPTLKKYLTILEQTFIIKLIKPFFTNKKKELVKNPKVYFVDNGFRNVCLNNFNQKIMGSEQEQFAITELIKNNFLPKFWNTKAKAEVDIIIEKNNEPTPIEVKTTLIQEKTTRSFMNFLEEYKPKKAFIISNNFEKEIIKQNHKITFLPIVKIKKIIEELK